MQPFQSSEVKDEVVDGKMEKPENRAFDGKVENRYKLKAGTIPPPIKVLVTSDGQVISTLTHSKVKPKPATISAQSEKQPTCKRSKVWKQDLTNEETPDVQEAGSKPQCQDFKFKCNVCLRGFFHKHSYDLHTHKGVFKHVCVQGSAFFRLFRLSGFLELNWTILEISANLMRKSFDPPPPTPLPTLVVPKASEYVVLK